MGNDNCQMKMLQLGAGKLEKVKVKGDNCTERYAGKCHAQFSHHPIVSVY